MVIPKRRKALVSSTVTWLSSWRQFLDHRTERQSPGKNSGVIELRRQKLESRAVETAEICEKGY